MDSLTRYVIEHNDSCFAAVVRDYDPPTEFDRRRQFDRRCLLFGTLWVESEWDYAGALTILEGQPDAIHDGTQMSALCACLLPFLQNTTNDYSSTIHARCYFHPGSKMRPRWDEDISVQIKDLDPAASLVCLFEDAFHAELVLHGDSVHPYHPAVTSYQLPRDPCGDLLDDVPRYACTLELGISSGVRTEFVRTPVFMSFDRVQIVFGKPMVRRGVERADAAWLTCRNRQRPWGMVADGRWDGCWRAQLCSFGTHCCEFRSRPLGTDEWRSNETVFGFELMSKNSSLEYFVEWMSALSHCSAVRIQRAFRRAVSDPAYTLCRNRLVREFRHLPYTHKRLTR